MRRPESASPLRADRGRTPSCRARRSRVRRTRPRGDHGRAAAASGGHDQPLARAGEHDARRLRQLVKRMVGAQRGARREGGPVLVARVQRHARGDQRLAARLADLLEPADRLAETIPSERQRLLRPLNLINRDGQLPVLLLISTVRQLASQALQSVSTVAEFPAAPAQPDAPASAPLVSCRHGSHRSHSAPSVSGSSGRVMELFARPGPPIAGQNRRRDPAATWVIADADDLVVAYASIAMTGIDRSSAPEIVRRVPRPSSGSPARPAGGRPPLRQPRDRDRPRGARPRHSR